MPTKEKCEVLFCQIADWVASEKSAAMLGKTPGRLQITYKGRFDGSAARVRDVEFDRIYY